MASQIKKPQTPKNLGSACLLFPDPLCDASHVSGAAFLYFDEPLVTTIPVQVVTTESFDLVRLIKTRRPDWADSLYLILGGWRAQQQQFNSSRETFQPLYDEGALISIWAVYPAGEKELRLSEELVATIGFSDEEWQQIIDPWTACSELARHIFLEAYLENGKDVNSLYDYCASLLNRMSLDTLLACGYLLRLRLLNKLSITGRPVFLTNERAVELLSRLPMENNSPHKSEFDKDVIAWEFFRQVVSPRVDSISPGSISVITDLRKNHRSEILRLRNKCLRLALETSDPDGLSRLRETVAVRVRATVEKEIADLFQLNKHAVEGFFEELFSDQKTWAGVLTAITGLVTGVQVFTAAGAIAALSSVSAKAVAQAAKRHQKINQSDYALIYHIGRRRGV